MIIDRWHIDRRFRGGRTEFDFQYGGNLDDFNLVESVIVEQMGGREKQRLYGPCGEVTVTFEVENYAIKLCADYYDLLFLLPASEDESYWVRLFALELEKKLNAIKK